jgi:hypothetical protein
VEGDTEIALDPPAEESETAPLPHEARRPNKQNASAVVAMRSMKRIADAVTSLPWILCRWSRRSAIDHTQLRAKSSPDKPPKSLRE